MSAYMTVTYIPEPDVEPRGRLVDDIPAIDLSQQFGRQPLRIQFNPADPADAIRYLRELATVAADLAYEIEDHVAEEELAHTAVDETTELSEGDKETNRLLHYITGGDLL